MKRISTTLLAGVLIVMGGCSSVTGGETGKQSGNEVDAAIKATEARVAEVKKAGFEWRLVDKAAGKKSVPISKLLKLAKTAAEKGDTAETQRLLKRINFAVDMGMKQATSPGKVFYPAR